VWEDGFERLGRGFGTQLTERDRKKLKELQKGLLQAEEQLKKAIEWNIDKEVQVWSQQCQNYEREMKLMLDSYAYDPTGDRFVRVDKARGNVIKVLDERTWTKTDLAKASYGVEQKAEPLPKKEVDISFYDAYGNSVAMSPTTWNTRASVSELRTDRVYVFWLEVGVDPQAINILRQGLDGQGIRYVIITGQTLPTVYELDGVVNVVLKQAKQMTEKESGQDGNTSSFTDAPRRRIRDIEEAPQAPLDTATKEQGAGETKNETDGQGQNQGLEGDENYVVWSREETQKKIVEKGSQGDQSGSEEKMGEVQSRTEGSLQDGKWF